MLTVSRAFVLLIVFGPISNCVSRAASVTSSNFLVSAESESVANQVAAAAEFQRKKLAMLWYGHELPDWAIRCSIEVDANPNKGAGGSTSFKFSGGEVYGWRMRVQGSVERILDSVIPHEVNHTILACYFRRKVPRWADEGAATIFEHDSERQRQIDEVQRLMHNGRRIPLRVLMSMSQYPSDMSQVMAMYAQSYSVTDYLIQKGGRQTFLSFLNDAHRRGWDAALRTHYEQKSIEHLEQDWAGWVMAGFPRQNLPPGQLLAGRTTQRDIRAQGEDVSNEPIVRGQSPASAEAATEPTRSVFTALPVPSLKPAIKVVTQIRASWRHTAAVISRVQNYSTKFAGLAAEEYDESLQAVELTPVETEPAIPADEEELRALELIPLNEMQTSRLTPGLHHQFATFDQRVDDPENPFVWPIDDNLSRLGSQPLSNERGAETGLRETRLHHEPETSRRSEALSDWGRFPTRVR
ncbi:hypothetical protein GC176_01920 [bacterium]|nr:hypothetical protein [bacterium]